MATQKSPTPTIEPTNSRHAHVLCWKSVAAGVLISVMSYLILSSLGAGFVGSAAQSVIENEMNGMALATGSVLWLGLSAVISLFLGSYFAVRMSKSVTNKVGAAHGFVVASVFFILMMAQVGSAISSLSSGFSRLTLGGSTLRADPQVVVDGLARRLLFGDVESAKSYFSYQTGLSGPEIDVKISTMRADFERAAKNAGEAAAKAVADTGWSLFVVFIVGLFSALVGGRTGAHANAERPLVVTDTFAVTMRSPELANERGSALLYIFGWLLGVPTSILFLILLLRSVF